jgi:hypothetical protein
MHCDDMKDDKYYLINISGFPFYKFIVQKSWISRHYIGQQCVKFIKVINNNTSRLIGCRWKKDDSTILYDNEFTILKELNDEELLAYMM